MDAVTTIATFAVVAGVGYAGWGALAEKRLERVSLPQAPRRKRGKEGRKRRRDGQVVSDVSSLTPLERRLALAGLGTDKRRALAMLAAAILVAALVGSVVAGGVGAIACAVATPVVAHVAVGARGARRTRRFEKQLATAEVQIAENLRGGLSVPRSLRTVSEQTEQPLKGQFEAVYNEVTYGNATLPEALGSMARRTANPDVELLATVIRVQDETGSDLSESLETLAEVLEKRTHMRNELDMALSEIRMTIKIVSVLPAVILAFTWAFYDGYAEFYSEPAGMAIVAAIAVIEAVTLVVLNRMTDIDFD